MTVPAVERRREHVVELADGLAGQSGEFRQRAPRSPPTEHAGILPKVGRALETTTP